MFNAFNLEQRPVWNTNLQNCKYRPPVIFKIRSDSNYHPQKQTILPLLIALQLDLNEAEDLLSRAGFAFSPSDPTDVIYRFCIENKIFNMDVVEELIYETEKV